jgi:hypothetical protein
MVFVCVVWAVAAVIYAGIFLHHIYASWQDRVNFCKEARMQDLAHARNREERERDIYISLLKWSLHNCSII